MDREEAVKASLAIRGNHARLKKLMRRAVNGDTIHIGFLGGSITQGSVASTPGGCYAALVFQWWVKKFPESRFSYINAGIGGTTSLFGASRVWMDLLRYRPDFVVIDFSVNDEAAEFFQESFEGVVRQVYGEKHKPAVMVLNNVFYDTGKNVQEFHNQVAEHYQIPCVSMKDSLYKLICAGVYEEDRMTPDHLHPNDEGHRFLADMLTGQLEAVYADMEHEEEEPEYPESYTANRFEKAQRLQIDNCRPRLEGFITDAREKKGMLDLYKNGWTGYREGDRIIFELECSSISVQFLRSVNQPRPVAEAVVDGDRDHAVLLDGNFDEDWGDCLALTTVYDKEVRAWHRLEIAIKEAHPKDVGGFYLVSVITD